MRRPRPLLALLLLALVSAPADVLDLFLALEKDYQRDAFIERFWAVRDPIKRTARNEFRDDYQARLEQAERFGFADRARILLLNGMPTERYELACLARGPRQLVVLVDEKQSTSRRKTGCFSGAIV